MGENQVSSGTNCAVDNYNYKHVMVTMTETVMVWFGYSRAGLVVGSCRRLNRQRSLLFTHISHPLFCPDIKTCFLLPFPLSLLDQKAACTAVENEEETQEREA